MVKNLLKVIHVLKSGTPKNVGCVWAAINKDRRLTVGEPEAHLGIPKPTLSKVLMQNFPKKVITGDESWVYPMIQKQRPSCPNGSHLVSLPEEGETKLQQDQDHV